MLSSAVPQRKPAMHAYIPSLLSLSPAPLPSSPIEVMSEHWVELPVLYGRFPLAILCMGVYIRQSYSPNWPHPSLLPLCPHISSLHLHLCSRLGNKFILNIFLGFPGGAGGFNRPALVCSLWSGPGPGPRLGGALLFEKAADAAWPGAHSVQSSSQAGVLVPDLWRAVPISNQLGITIISCRGKQWEGIIFIDTTHPYPPHTCRAGYHEGTMSEKLFSEPVF